MPPGFEVGDAEGAEVGDAEGADVCDLEGGEVQDDDDPPHPGIIDPGQPFSMYEAYTF